MKLLFDENLSPRLCSMLADVFPGSESVLQIGLGGSDDGEIWNYALGGGFTIVSKDLDFVDRAIVSSTPVKVIWIRMGNCTTQAAHLVLRNRAEAATQFANSEDVVLELTIGSAIPRP